MMYSQYGAGCHMSKKGQCRAYDGEDRDGCMLSPRGGSYFNPMTGKTVTVRRNKCMREENVAHMFAPKSRYGPGMRPEKSAKRVAASKRAAGQSAWIDHVKRVAAEQGLSYKEALQEAKKTYVKRAKVTRQMKTPRTPAW